MKKSYILAIVVLFIFTGCKKEVDPLEKFIGIWGKTATLDESVFKGQQNISYTIKRTSTKTVSVDYSARFTGAYSGYPATTVADGSLGIFTLEGSGLFSYNPTYTIVTTTTYQKNGAPVVIKESPSLQYQMIQLLLNNSGQLEYTTILIGGKTNSPIVFQKQ